MISLVVTTCDRPALLIKALQSALTQNHVGEVIVVDDGMEKAGNIPEDLRVIRTPGRIGVCAARNLGLEAAALPWIAYLDDDDELQENAYDGAMDAFSAGAQNIVVSTVEHFDEDGVFKVRVPTSTARGSIWGMEFDLQQDGRSFYCKQSAVYQTEFLRSIGGWEERLRSRSQTDLYFRISKESSITGIDYPCYRLNRSRRFEHLTGSLTLRIRSFVFLMVRHFGLWTTRKQGWWWLLSEIRYIVTMMSSRLMTRGGA